MKVQLLLNLNHENKKNERSNSSDPQTSPNTSKQTPSQNVQNLVSPSRIMQPRRKSHLFGYLFKNLVSKCTAELLQKNVKERNAYDIKMIDKFINNSQIFNEYSETLTSEIRIELCKFLRYEKIDQGKMIQNANSRVENLYFLISGRVKQTEPEKKQIKRNQIFQAKKEVKEKFIIIDSNLLKDSVTFSFPNAEFITHNICKCKYEALDDCYFATITYREFDQIISNTKSKDLLYEISYFSRISFFSKWNVNTIKFIVQNQSKKQFKINQLVTDQESFPDYWYIIREGEFNLQRTFEIETPKKQQQNDMMVQHKQAKSFTQTQSISILQKNEFFGLEDIISNQKRQYSVKCTSEIGVLSIISSKEIIKLMNKNIVIQIDIQRISSEKTKFIQERINQIEQQLIQSQIKKIENRGRNISIQQQATNAINISKDNMEKIQQVEDMLQIQEQQVKINTAKGKFQISEGLEEQKEIKKFLKQKGFNSISTHLQSTIEQAQEQSRIQNEKFKEKLKVDSIVKKDTLKQKEELLDFYRKMIQDEYSTQKRKQSKQFLTLILIISHSINIQYENKSKGFKNFKINFFYKKVIQPMQEAQKQKNINKMQRIQQTDQQFPYRKLNAQAESSCSSQYSQLYSSPVNLLKNNLFSNQSYEQNNSYFSNMSNNNLLRKSESQNSLEVFIKNRKIKTPNNHTEFSSTFYSQFSEPSQVNSQDIEANNTLFLQTSPNFRSLIKRTIQKNYQNESQQTNNMFVNYGDRFKNLSSQLNSISICAQLKPPLEKQSQIQQLFSNKISRINSIQSPTQKEDNSSEYFQNSPQSQFSKTNHNSFKPNLSHQPLNFTQQYYNPATYPQKQNPNISSTTEVIPQKKSISFYSSLKGNHCKTSFAPNFPTQPQSPSFKNYHQ